MTTVTEGEGWKKPSRLDRASVRLTTAAAAAAEPTKSVERVLTLGRAELGAGVDAALMQCKRGAEVSLSLRGGVGEDGEDAAVHAKRAIADALGTSAPAAALEVQLVLLSWVAVEDLSDGQESLLLLMHEAGDESDYKMPKVSQHWL
jgi:hypothetical protein